MQTTITKILGEKEGAVYLAALELGTATIADISHKAQLPRSTCYLFIEELEQHGLLNRTTKGKKGYIVAESPEKLLQTVEEEKTKLTDHVSLLVSALPELKAIYNKPSYKPLVRYYEGFQGVKTILEDTLKSAEILVWCSGYEKGIEKRLSDYLDTYFDAVNRKGIATRELLGSSPDMEGYIGSYESDLHKIKEVSFQRGIKHIDKLVYGSKTAYLSFEELNGVVIENHAIAEFERSIFNMYFRQM